MLFIATLIDIKLNPPSVDYISIDAEDEDPATEAAQGIAESSDRLFSCITTDEGFLDLASSFDDSSPDYVVGGFGEKE